MSRLSVLSVVMVLYGLDGFAARPSSPNTRLRSEPAVLKSYGIVEPSIRFSRLDLENGLPVLHVTSIVQDTAGFIWIGTPEGLVRYDGLRVKIHRKDDTDNSLSDSEISALAADTSGGLWVGTTSGGLNHLDVNTGKITRFLHDPMDPKTLSGPSVSVIYVAADGNVWVGVNQGGLSRLGDPRGEFFVPHALADITPRAIAEKGDGTLFIGTEANGLIHYDPRKDTIIAEYLAAGAIPGSSASANVSSIMFDHAGNLWTGLDGSGLAVLDMASGRFRYFRHSEDDASTLGDDFVKAVIEVDGSIYVGTKHSGLNQLLPDRKTFIRHKVDSQVRHRFAYNEVTTIFKDRGGLVWVGTWSGGISMFDALAARFAYYQIGSGTTNSFFEEPDGTVWFGKSPSQLGSGVYRMQPSKRRYTLYQRLGSVDNPLGITLSDYWITALHKDPAGSLWIATLGAGLVAFDPETEKFKRYLAESPDSEDAAKGEVLTLHSQQNTLWIGTRNGLATLTPGQDQPVFFPSDWEGAESLSESNVIAIQVDRRNPNLVWVGTAFGGLNLLNLETRTFRAYVNDAKNSKSLSSNWVQSIFQDTSGVLWLGTKGGLNRFDPSTESVERYDHKYGIPATTIYGVLPDETGNLWLSTNGNGLYVFNPNTNKVINYIVDDGLQSNEFIQGSFHRGTTGRLFWGGPNGFHAVIPSEIYVDRYTPPVLLTDMKIFNKSVSLAEAMWRTSDLTLSYLDSSFSFEYAALSFAGATRNRFQYRLSGFHPEWIDSTERGVSYTNLDPGNYVFEVQATGRHGMASEGSASVRLYVKPPPWKTWWAFVLYFVALAAAVRAYLRYQAQRVEAARTESRLSSVEHDLELTAALQTGFLPTENNIREPGFRLVGVYKAAEQCSGDWWWYEKSLDGTRYIFVGDVTGHGPGPAMVTAAVGGAIRILKGDGNGMAPSRILPKISDQVRSISKGDYYMTLSAIELHEQTDTLVLHSAAGLPMLYCGTDGPRTYLVQGTPLGSESFHAGSVQVKIKVGDRLMLLTDGIPEVAFSNGRQFGMKRLLRTYEATWNMDLDEAAKHILKEVSDALGSSSQQDDWTFVLIEWKPEARTAAPVLQVPRDSRPSLPKAVA